ncbi:toll/interleukin-1 receptor domain-containing protein [Mesorhizobium sp. B1-1-6]|uniref:toll/interleukin-1 receptor domain-containing protein n=1 Tax=Mesorhizobium sp. B1-1-6 TaxID=2589978 RepID=UPI0015E459C0|nr:toll/interleukin-1 receptor domain-containing protein [Mesorhizobium sp. B1-1-6]
MSNKMLFLSHIHEERELAVLIKSELESEFSGFVDVFVSSDGVSIPAGANFLKRIEDGLVACVGALYLISPKSVARTWISFELGAVWVRNAMSLRSGGVEIPALPVCHSGMKPGALPAPLSNLNGIVANQSSQLEFAFRSIQSAVGGKGGLKTDFDQLSARIIAFENAYTLGASLVRLLKGINVPGLIAHCEANPNTTVNIQFGFVPNEQIDVIRGLERNELQGRIKVEVKSSVVAFGADGAQNGGDIEVMIGTALLLQFRNELLSAA